MKRQRLLAGTLLTGLALFTLVGSGFSFNPGAPGVAPHCPGSKRDSGVVKTDPPTGTPPAVIEDRDFEKRKSGAK